MKKRKVLAFVLALAMVVTLIPMSAFASTDNETNKVPTVSDDSAIPTVVLSLEAKDTFKSTSQAFTLRLTNAEWARAKSERPADYKNVTYVAVTKGNLNWSEASKDTDRNTSEPSISVTRTSSVTSAAAFSITAVSETDNTVELLLESEVPIQDGERIEIEMALWAGDEEGPATVQVIDNSSEISPSSSLNVATVSNGDTTTTVLDTPTKVWRGSGLEGAQIQIRENAVNAIKAEDQVFELQLPAGVKWDAKETEKHISGSMIASDNTASAVIVDSPDDRKLKISFKAAATSNTQTLVITPYFSVTGDAKLGDISVTLRKGDGYKGQITAQSGLITAQYVEENVLITTVKEADLPQIIAGREYEDGTDAHEIEVYVEEEIASALSAGRFIEFEFPDYVQIVSGEPIKVKKTGSPSIDEVGSNAISTIAEQGNFDTKMGSGDEDTSTFEYTLPTGDNLKSTVKDKFTFIIPVTVEANAKAGDLMLKVSGAKAGIADTELVVGKIIEPVSVTVQVSDLRTGIQQQPIGDIIIKENVPGALMEEVLELSLESDLKATIKNFDKDAVTVVSGDIELKTSSIKSSSGTMSIEIDTQSAKTPAEIKISGVSVNLDRTPAEGKYKLQVGGLALVKNKDYNKEDFANYVVEPEYINVITLADTNLYGNATFAIGQSTYEVYINGVVTTRALDAPPYIDPAGRTMVSVKYAANALGVADNNIIWDQNSKTATIFKDGRVVVFKSGSNQYSMNGANVAMDVTCANVGGRLFIPIAHLANAFGTDYEWDATARTVKLMNRTDGGL